jgi:hypothetical protein
MRTARTKWRNQVKEDIKLNRERVDTDTREKLKGR